MAHRLLEANYEWAASEEWKMARNRSIGLSIIATLVAIWTGLAWYAGKRAEMQFVQFIGAANVKLAALDASEQSVPRIEVVL